MMEANIIQYHQFAAHVCTLSSTDLENRNFQYEVSGSEGENCIQYLIKEDRGFTMGFRPPDGCYNLSSPKEPYLLVFFRTKEHSEAVFELHTIADLESYLVPLYVVETSSLSGYFPKAASPYLHQHKGRLELILISRQTVPEELRYQPIKADSVSFQLMEFREGLPVCFPPDFYTHLN
jgi:hypothetical protein